MCMMSGMPEDHGTCLSMMARLEAQLEESEARADALTVQVGNLIEELDYARSEISRVRNDILLSVGAPASQMPATDDEVRRRKGCTHPRNVGCNEFYMGPEVR